MPGTRAKRIRKWVMRSLAIVVLLILVAVVGLWYWGGPYAQRIIHAKLQQMVSDQLNATLEMGSIEYEYPFAVTVSDVALVTQHQGEQITLASFDQLRLQLTRLPFDDGPLQIQRIDIDSPTLHAIRTAEGFVGQTDLVRSDEERTRRQAPNLSEIFHLRHLKLTDARVMYEDRRSPEQTPLVWRDLNITLESQPEGASHTFEFTGNSGHLATIDGRGKVDIDTLVLDLDHLKIQTRILPNQRESPLPPEVTQLLTRYQVAGVATVEISGHLPALSYRNGNAKLTLKVENATAVHPDFPDPLQDLDLTVSAGYADGHVNTTMELLAARSGSMGISASRFNVLMDLETMQWTASPVRFAVAYAPTNVTKSVLDQPATLFVVASPTQKGGLTEIAVDLSGSSLTLPNLNDELQLTGSFEIHPESIILNPTTITGLGGTTYVDGWYHLPTEQAAANLKVESLSLASLKTLAQPREDQEFKGRLNSNVTVRMTGTDLSTFTAYGTARVNDGAFARVPVLADLANFLRMGQGLFTAESAYARFRVEDQTINLERVAASTNALRVRGEGSITFDENLDLRLYVIGNGDWGKGVKNTGIPIISDVGGLLAGGAQKVVTGVTTQFTTVRVRGTIDDPKITPDPAPAITDRVKKLFESE